MGSIAEPDLTAELDAAEWWVLVPAAPRGGHAAVLGPYGSGGEARAQVARTRQYGLDAKLLRTAEEEEP